MAQTQPQSNSPGNSPPISLRFTCAANGEQVGLSHYLMTAAGKNQP
jgi:modified peptide precursor CbpA